MTRLSAVSRRVLLAVLALTVLGFALRLARYQQSLLGDESSTLYLTKGRSFSDVISLISSDAEITPPFYFVLAWLAQKLGSAPELIRLPSLIAGTVSIPLVYLLGARLISRPAGLIAATVMALNPNMIFYSGDGRGYSVAVALLLASTLAMLEAMRGGKTRWWVGYAALSCLAMYTHYTAAFVLIAQLGWLFWAHPNARRPALISNLGAAVLFLPWIPSVIKDSHSPTLDVLSYLQGKTFAIKRQAVEIWAIGYPFKSPRDVPGVFAAVLGLTGFLVASVVSLVRFRARSHALNQDPDDSKDPDESAASNALSKAVVLVVLLAIATPVFEIVIWKVTGNDLFGSRNLNTASAGLALLIGMVLAGAGRIWGTVCTIAVIGCFAIGAAHTLTTDTKLPDFKSAAAYVDANAGPDDVVVDLLSPRVTPVPLTSLDSYLPQTRDEFRPLLPRGEPPFLPSSPVPSTSGLLQRAVEDAQGHRLFLIVPDAGLERDGDRAETIVVEPFIVGSAPPVRFDLPPGSRIVAEERFPGLGPVNVITVEPGLLGG